MTEQKQREQRLNASQRALSAVVHISEKDPSFMKLTEENRRTAASIFAQMSPGGMIGGYCEDGFLSISPTMKWSGFWATVPLKNSSRP